MASKQKPGVMLYFSVLENIKDFSIAQKGQILDAIICYAIDHQEPQFTDGVAEFAWRGFRQMIDKDSERYAEIVRKNTLKVHTSHWYAYAGKNGLDPNDTEARDRYIAERMSAKECDNGSHGIPQYTTATTVDNGSHGIPQLPINNNIYNNTGNNITHSDNHSDNNNLTGNPNNPGINIYNPDDNNNLMVSGGCGGAENTSGEENPTSPPACTTKPRKKKQAFVPPTIEEVRAYCQERHNNVNPEKFIAHYEMTKWTRGNNIPIQDWKAAVRYWEANDRNWSNQRKENVNVADTNTQEDDPWMHVGLWI